MGLGYNVGHPAQAEGEVYSLTNDEGNEQQTNQHGTPVCQTTTSMESQLGDTNDFATEIKVERGVRMYSA